MKISKIVLRVAVVMLVLVVVAELLVRLLFSQPLDPGRKFIFANEIPGLKEKVTVRLDANQVRGFDSTRPKASGSVRILCVGGAATATMLQNAEDTWWGQLGKQLEEATGQKVEIGCVGAPDSVAIISGAQWLDHILGEVDDVDLVIAMGGRVELLHPRADFVFDPEAIEPVRIEKRGGLMFGLAKMSHLVRVARNMHINSKRNEQQRRFAPTNYLRDRFALAGQAYRSIPTAGTPSGSGDAIDAYLYGIGMLVEVCKSSGTQLVLVGEPTIFSSLMEPEAAAALHTPVHVGPGAEEFVRPVPGWVDQELARFYGAGKSVADSAGVPFVNLQGVVLPTRENFFNESIVTDLGASRLGSALLPVAKAALE